MARKHSPESSEEDLRDSRYKRKSSSHRHRRDYSDGSESEEGSRAKRKEIKHGERREKSESSDEEGQIHMEEREEGDRVRRSHDGRGRREAEEEGRRESRGRNGEDNEKRDRPRAEEDRRRGKDRRARRDSEDEEDDRKRGKDEEKEESRGRNGEDNGKRDRPRAEEDSRRGKDRRARLDSEDEEDDRKRGKDEEKEESRGRNREDNGKRDRPRAEEDRRRGKDRRARRDSEDEEDDRKRGKDEEKEESRGRNSEDNGKRDWPRAEEDRRRGNRRARRDSEDEEDDRKRGKDEKEEGKRVRLTHDRDRRGRKEAEEDGRREPRGRYDEDDGDRRRDRHRADEDRHRGKDHRTRGDLDNGDSGRNRERDRSEKDMQDGQAKSAMNAEGSLNGAPANWGKSGGVYMPPFKLARMMKEVDDKSSPEYQRLTWDALRKSINGLVNKVNATNIKNIIPELLSENLIRGRGLFCRSCMKSQMASPGFTDVFAALVAVVNTKFPEVGELLLKRIVLQLKRAYKRNDKPQLLAAVKFVAHLVNQQVAHEIIALELLTVLLEKPTDDSVEVAVGFVTECGSILQELSPKGLHGIFERFRGILHEGEIDKRVQFLIEGLFAIRKAKFQGYPAVRPELDLVELEDQLTHEVSLDEGIEPETSLDIFKVDPNYLDNEKRYEEVKKTILGEEADDEEGSDADSDSEADEDDDDDEEEDEDEESMQIKDETETNLVNLRRTIYLTIMSSVDFEEAGHKLLKIHLEPGQEMELCIMLLECCSQERTYLRYYGLLGQRFCVINKVHQENFEKCFVQQYSMIHRLETNKLRNVAKFFAHLLGTDALPWHVLSYIRLTEDDTTSSSRIFIKILFQELSEHLGIKLLNERLNDPTMQDNFESIFPKDNPKNTRFCINFFTSIGLGGLTENLREYLKNMPRLIMQQQKQVSDSEPEDEPGSPDSSDSGTSSSESESESESDRERHRKRRRK